MPIWGVTFTWPDGFARIPDEPWATSPLETLALKYDRVPIARSTNGFCQGDCFALTTSLMLIAMTRLRETSP